MSVVRRGQWNSKLESAATFIRKRCDFAFRKTAYAHDDLSLPHLIEELARVTCVTCSRHLSVDWYLEGLHAHDAKASEPAPEYTRADTNGDLNTTGTNDLSKHPVYEMTPSTQGGIDTTSAIEMVRRGGCPWNWLLLKIEGDCTNGSSGGA